MSKISNYDQMRSFIKNAIAPKPVLSK